MRRDEPLLRDGRNSPGARENDDNQQQTEGKPQIKVDQTGLSLDADQHTGRFSRGLDHLKPLEWRVSMKADKLEPQCEVTPVDRLQGQRSDLIMSSKVKGVVCGRDVAFKYLLLS